MNLVKSYRHCNIVSVLGKERLNVLANNSLSFCTHHGTIRIILGPSLYVYRCFILFIDTGIGKQYSHSRHKSPHRLLYWHLRAHINRFTINIIFFPDDTFGMLSLPTTFLLVDIKRSSDSSSPYSITSKTFILKVFPCNPKRTSETVSTYLKRLWGQPVFASNINPSVFLPLAAYIASAWSPFFQIA